MLGAESVSTLKEAVSVVQSICAELVTSSNAYSPTVTPSHYRIDFDNYHLPCPQPLTSRLTREGIPSGLAEEITDSYLRTAEGLKSQTEAIFRETCSKLLVFPHRRDLIPSAKLCDQIFDIQRHNYLSTLSQWEEEAIGIATSRLAARTELVIVGDTQEISPPEPQPHSSRKKSRRPFKSEFLPLLEFAFSKDDFPSREDKKHLARISNMSYRQVSVWFQNRRCRTAKTNSTSRPLQPPPQTLKEGKEPLSVSAKASLDAWVRRASSSSGPGVTRESTMEPVSMTETEHVAESSRAPPPPPVLAFEGIAETSEPLGTLDNGFDFEPLFANDFCEGTRGREAIFRLEGTFSPSPNPAIVPLPESPTSSPFPGPASTFCHSYAPSFTPSHVFNPKPPTPNIFPAPYSPSKPTFDPFVIEHTPWLRHPAERRIQTIKATPEVMEGILRSLEDMMELDVVAMPLPSKEQQQLRLKKTLPPHRSRFSGAGTGDAELSSALTENLSREASLGLGPLPRKFSGSSGLSSSPSSSEYASSLGESPSCRGASAPASRSSSYSSASSSCSTFSTPLLSETDLPAMNDDAICVYPQAWSGHSMTGSLDMPVMSTASEEGSDATAAGTGAA